jgi:hypothetical protein
MPVPLDARRDRRFRPVRLTERHRLVAMMRALGKRRDEIAAATGYTPSHVSRVAHMPAVREEVARLSATVARTLIDSHLRLVRSQTTPSHDLISQQ